jgi:hypothetical protein
MSKYFNDGSFNKFTTNPFIPPIEIDQKSLYEGITKIGKIDNGLILKLKEDYFEGLWKLIGSAYSEFNLSKSISSEICLFYVMCVFSTNRSGTPFTNITVGGIKRDLFDNSVHPVILTELATLKDKLHHLSQIRSRLVGKAYNFYTNKLEYELEDGTYVEINGDTLKKPFLNVTKDIFPDCYLGATDLASMRESRINKILDGYDNNKC